LRKTLLFALCGLLIAVELKFFTELIFLAAAFDPPKQLAKKRGHFAS
jgi:hypothetical protein